MAKTPVLKAEETVQESISLFTSGYNCSQSALLALQRAFDAEDIPANVAACFGGGIASTGGPCGILTGSLMALGLIAGPENAADPDARAQCSEVGAELIESFRGFAGDTINCSDLTDRPRRRTSGWPRLQGSTKETVCIPLMERFMRHCHELLSQR